MLNSANFYSKYEKGDLRVFLATNEIIFYSTLFYQKVVTLNFVIYKTRYIISNQRRLEVWAGVLFENILQPVS